ncbi:MAG: DeoR/GlpR family DNA-binding transcription regulator [Bacillus sp. (in: firmicutes)]
MLTAERHHIILESLTKHGVVDLQGLVNQTGSSESTIRRDLAHLEKQGLLKRIHGGATLPYSKVDEPNIQDKSAKHLGGKRVIAEAAAEMILDGDCIYLDAGSTVAQMLPYLAEKRIVVVTNGLMHIDALSASSITTYLLGGRIKPNTRAVVGSVAQESLKKYRFDRCFLGTNGVDLKFGFTTPDPEEGVLKHIASEMSERTFVLADRSKFGETFFSQVADIEEATIITDHQDKELIEKYREKTDVKVVTT